MVNCAAISAFSRAAYNLVAATAGKMFPMCVLTTNSNPNVVAAVSNSKPSIRSRTSPPVCAPSPALSGSEHPVPQELRRQGIMRGQRRNGAWGVPADRRLGDDAVLFLGVATLTLYR